MENQNNSETKFCQKCGKKIDVTSTFCPHCGATQGNTNQTTMEQTLQNGNVNQNVKGSVGSFLTFGWLASVIGLFIPIVAIAGIVLGILTVIRKHNAAGIVLIIFACIALYFGLTGFSEGFFGAL